MFAPPPSALGMHGHPGPQGHVYAPPSPIPYGGGGPAPMAPHHHHDAAPVRRRSLSWKAESGLPPPPSQIDTMDISRSLTPTSAAHHPPPRPASAMSTSGGAVHLAKAPSAYERMTGDDMGFRAAREASTHMSAVSKHPKVKLDIVLSSTTFEAGGTVSGRLELTSTTSSRLRLGEIAVELEAFEELSSRDHSATQMFLFNRTLFQGEHLPPSNAVMPSAPHHGYWTARKGRTTFPFSFRLPATAPSSVVFAGNAALRYSLKGTVQAWWNDNKSVVTARSEAFVVERWEDEDSPTFKEPVEAVADTRLFMGGAGAVWLEAGLSEQLFTAGGQALLRLGVKNNTKRDLSGLKVSVVRRLIFPVSGPPGAPAARPSLEPRITEALHTQAFKGPAFEFPAGEEVVTNVAIDIPNNVRTIRKTRLFEVQVLAIVSASMGNFAKDLSVEIPFFVAHTASLQKPAGANLDLLHGISHVPPRAPSRAGPSPAPGGSPHHPHLPPQNQYHHHHHDPHHPPHHHHHHHGASPYAPPPHIPRSHSAMGQHGAHYGTGSHAYEASHAELPWAQNAPPHSRPASAAPTSGAELIALPQTPQPFAQTSDGGVVWNPNAHGWGAGSFFVAGQQQQQQVPQRPHSAHPYATALDPGAHQRQATAGSTHLLQQAGQQRRSSGPLPTPPVEGSSHLQHNLAAPPSPLEPQRANSVPLPTDPAALVGLATIEEDSESLMGTVRSVRALLAKSNGDGDDVGTTAVPPGSVTKRDVGRFEEMADQAEVQETLRRAREAGIQFDDDDDDEEDKSERSLPKPPVASTKARNEGQRVRVSELFNAQPTREADANNVVQIQRQGNEDTVSKLPTAAPTRSELRTRAQAQGQVAQAKSGFAAATTRELAPIDTSPAAVGSRRASSPLSPRGEGLGALESRLRSPASPVPDLAPASPSRRASAPAVQASPASFGTASGGGALRAAAKAKAKEEEERSKREVEMRRMKERVNSNASRISSAGHKTGTQSEVRVLGNVAPKPVEKGAQAEHKIESVASRVTLSRSPLGAERSTIAPKPAAPSSKALPSPTVGPTSSSKPLPTPATSLSRAAPASPKAAQDVVSTSQVSLDRSASSSKGGADAIKKVVDEEEQRKLNRMAVRRIDGWLGASPSALDEKPREQVDADVVERPATPPASVLVAKEGEESAFHAPSARFERKNQVFPPLSTSTRKEAQQPSGEEAPTLSAELRALVDGSAVRPTPKPGTAIRSHVASRRFSGDLPLGEASASALKKEEPSTLVKSTPPVSQRRASYVSKALSGGSSPSSGSSAGGAGAGAGGMPDLAARAIPGKATFDKANVRSLGKGFPTAQAQDRVDVDAPIDPSSIPAGFSKKLLATPAQGEAGAGKFGSARGGRGGRVSSVAAMWASIADGQDAANSSSSSAANTDGGEGGQDVSNRPSITLTARPTPRVGAKGGPGALDFSSPDKAAAKEKEALKRDLRSPPLKATSAPHFINTTMPRAVFSAATTFEDASRAPPQVQAANLITEVRKPVAVRAVSPKVSSAATNKAGENKLSDTRKVLSDRIAAEAKVNLASSSSSAAAQKSDAGLALPQLSTAEMKMGGRGTTKPIGQGKMNSLRSLFDKS